MNTVDDRPAGLEEQIGAAVGASRLTLDSEHDESHLLRMAALGGAANRIALNIDGPHTLVATVSRDCATMRYLAGAGTAAHDERCETEARLAPLLWRMKYGRDVSCETAIEAVRLFVCWNEGTLGWRNHPVSTAIARPLCARVIYEWLADRCPACRGTGLQELLRNGMTRMPKRFGDPNVRHVQCRGCGGTSLVRVNAMERARVLEVSLAQYRALWASRMWQAGINLRRISRRLKKPLRSELERDYNRA